LLVLLRSERRDSGFKVGVFGVVGVLVELTDDPEDGGRGIEEARTEAVVVFTDFVGRGLLEHFPCGTGDVLMLTAAKLKVNRRGRGLIGLVIFSFDCGVDGG
jgi:hypothetical protein